MQVVSHPQGSQTPVLQPEGDIMPQAEDTLIPVEEVRFFEMQRNSEVTRPGVFGGYTRKTGIDKSRDHSAGRDTGSHFNLNVSTPSSNKKRKRQPAVVTRNGVRNSSD